ncbi:MAG: carboxymuconolactone decarboxylase family protein [Bradyrhizobium sp.]|jgi:AhpD family alkylhydroperoxidase
MTARLRYWQVAPEVTRRIGNVNSYLINSQIEPTLRHLVWLRVSQINGCAYCVDLHIREALRDGESPDRLHGLVVWRETELYSAKERAALAWAEALTLVAETHAPDEIYREVTQHFSDQDLVDLTFLIATMNAWNRMAIGFRRGPEPR